MGNRYLNDGAFSRAFAITKDDSTDLAQPTRGLIVGTTGDVSVVMAEDSSPGTPVLLPKLAAGVVHPLRVRRVRVTGTEPTTIVGLV